jgi:nucleoside-diphosphate-sugar epimerase
MALRQSRPIARRRNSFAAPVQRHRILLLGANSRLARTLLAHPDFDGVGLGRSGGDVPNVRTIDDYAVLSPADFEGFDTIINAIGVSNGTERLLFQVNVALPSRLARLARQAGVRQFLQISSFSVFGDAAYIGNETLLAPMSRYGESRLEAERALQSLESGQFAVTVVRLPMLYGFGDSKLERLVRTWVRFRYFPVPSHKVQRSVLHYAMAADALVYFAQAEPKPALALADPVAFEYPSAADLLSHGSNRPIRTILLPGCLTNMVTAIAPSLGRSLFSGSLLDPSSNVAIQLGLQTRLHQDLFAMATKAALP